MATQRDPFKRDVTDALNLVTKAARIIKENDRPTEPWIGAVWTDLQAVMSILAAIDARTGRRDPSRRKGK